MSFAEAASFFGSYLRHPRDVSSIIPTSKTSARSIAGHVRPSGPCVVVEYGPGVGSVSAAVLKRLGLADRLILIEKTPALAAGLRKHFAGDQRVIVVEGDALDVESIVAAQQVARPQYILSSIPLSLMTPTVRRGILEATARVLGPEGTFIVFLFRRRATKSYLCDLFSRIEFGVLPWNVPPLWLFIAKL